MVQVLHRLPKTAHPDLLVGTELFDDAGVFRLDGETALVQTLDFFPPLVDDPFTFGQIAAANALSDVYAMGGRPLTALNIVGFPDQDLSAELLVEILRGGAEKVAEAEVALVGGHSVRDAEIKYGLSVTGIVHPDRFCSNAGAKPGDQLVLTKPIGSGVLTSAAKSDRMDEADLAEAIAVMTHLNRSGGEAMMEVGVNAATDVTGFGLLGHAYELAEASNVSLHLNAQSVPLLARAFEFATQGIVTRIHKATLAHLGDNLTVGDVDPVLVNLLADAQTSGGLLISVPPDRTEALIAAIDRRGAPCAVVIGEATARDGASIHLS